MSLHTDTAREAARDRTSGRFGEQPKLDPGPNLVEVPGPPACYLEAIWQAMRDGRLADATPPATIAELRTALSADVAGLNRDQQEWLTERVLALADMWLRCQEVLDLPGGASWPAINARIPKSVQGRVPRSGFQVRDDSNLEIDREDGRVLGRTFVRYGTNDEWVAALADSCTQEITSVIRRAREASDRRSPSPRPRVGTDPWVGETCTDAPF